MNIEHLTLPVDANGHWYPQGTTVDVVRLDGELFPGSAPPSCGSCDQRPDMHLGDDVAQILAPCPHPDGVTTEITIDVPSGRLLVSDDLRPVFTWDDTGSASYNSVLGQAHAIEAMAAVGCAYGPVGNTSPGLYRTGPDSYIIASPGYDEDENPSLPEDTCLASVCTDLWAYSLSDFEHWKTRGGDPNSLGWSDTVVDVAPGRYRFTHHSGERGFDRDSVDTVTFAHVERIA